MRPIELVDRWIAAVVGEECWGVAAGGCVGTAFTMEFGRKMRRPRPLTNVNLTEEQKLFHGEVSLYVQDSSWKLCLDSQLSAQVITESSQSELRSGSIVHGLNSVLGQSVTNVLYKKSTHDLELLFHDSGKRLKIAGQVEPDSTGYSLFLHEDVVSLEGNLLTVEHA